MFKIYFFVFMIFLTELQAQPKLELSINNYDFGLVKINQSPLKTNIKIYNQGDSVLLIQKVKTDCGCTLAPLDKKMINPGDSANISISLDINSYKGLINKLITIYSNSSPTPITTLTLTANVFRSLDYQSLNYFNFGEVVIGKDYTKIIKVKNKTDKTYKITSINNPYNYISIKIPQKGIIKSKGLVKIGINLNILEPGPFSFNVFLETNCPDSPELVISGWGVAKK